eukprot:TRINITY_DN10407_c0_g1_i1.p1 TRINITY_DN10407_c0_g1~~TRINITY_DN10407_c0_g1_i1.p1  ORF type:complete len:353 (+),score=68.67 TRINITY_DN10407_c0_g1_i1:67-1059(+)
MRVLVFFLFVYISFTYVSVWLADFLPRFDHWFGNLFGLLSVSVFHFFVVQLGVNYYLCLTSSPGAVPSAWKPDGIPEKQLETIKQASITSRYFANPKSIRYCRYCETYKPPSSHHCSSCKICVVRKDHHCPWINNCVGLRNHKYFILFLLYATLGCCFCIALHATTIVAYLAQHRTSPNTSHDNNNNPATAPVVESFELTVPVCVMMAVSLFLLIPVTIVLSTLLAWQVWLSVNDQTTIEAEWEAAHKSSSKSHSNNSSSNTTNKDEATSSSNSSNSSNDTNSGGRLVRYTHNLSQIFGPFSYHWLMPTKPRLRLPSYLEEEKGHRDLEV